MESIQEIKVILLGCHGVGKSSLILRYTSDTFLYETVVTVGTKFCKKIVEVDSENKICLNIWDTAGQEKYKTVNRLYYNGAAACVLVYDICEKSTFEELKHFYSKEIKEYLPKDIILVVCGNKSGLYENEEVSEKEAKEFSDSLGAMYFKTSAKYTTGVDKVFQCIAKKYFDPEFQNNSSYILNGNRSRGKSIKIEESSSEVEELERKRKFCCL